MQAGDFSFLTHSLSVLSAMAWQIYWPLAFGLMLSSLVRHLLPMSTVVKHLGQTSVSSVLYSSLLGSLSSSCSYAAASLSKTLLIKRASLANAMVFLVASTNLIAEMFIVLVALMGWAFLWGEILAAVFLIVMVALFFKCFYPKDIDAELRQSIGSPAMIEALDEAEPVAKSTKTAERIETASSLSANELSDHTADQKSKVFVKDQIAQSAGFFQMDLSMIGRDIAIGVLISSLLIAWVPMSAWQTLFIEQVDLPVWLHSTVDVLIGIFVAVIAYVCSVGNLLLAAALWHGGISFGGVIGFILADVLTLPMIGVYQTYYGKRPVKWMVGLLFAAIVLTGLLVDALFYGLGIELNRDLTLLSQDSIGWNFTTAMNLIFIPLSVWYYRLGKRVNANQSMSM